jgi:hypothetical protein
MPQAVKPPSPFARILSLLRTGPRALSLRFYDQIRRRMTGTPVWGLSRITPNLYIGGQHTSVKGFQQEGITAVVNMREIHHDDLKRGIGGTTHLHLATRDNTPPTMDDLEKGADFIDTEIKAGGKVYVHCAVGVGRAPSMAAAYLIKHEKMTAVDAIALIRLTRPFVHLTGKQMRQLIAYEESVRAAAEAQAKVEAESEAPEQPQ